MSAVDGSVTLSPQEAIARDVIVRRIAARHVDGGVPHRTRRHVRTAVLLRRLAERLDPTTHRDDATRQHARHAVPVDGSGRTDRTGPRPWSADRRQRSPHRHTA